MKDTIWLWLQEEFDEAKRRGHHLSMVTINTNIGDDDYVLHAGVTMDHVIDEVAKLEPNWTSFVLTVVRVL